MAAAGLPVRARRRRPPHDRDRCAPPHEPLWGPNGLAPAIAQDAADGRVLMLAWMDEEALARDARDRRRPLPLADARPPLAEGRVVGPRAARPRPRARLRRRRDPSPVEPVGPTCHRDTRSCFDRRRRARRPDDPGLRLVGDLWATIAVARGGAARRLLHGRSPRRRRGRGRPQGDRGGHRGPDRRQGRRGRRGSRHRSRDARGTRSPARPPTSLYHALVLLAERAFAPSAVIDVLRGRHAGLTARAGARRPSARAPPDREPPLAGPHDEPLAGDRRRNGRVDRADPLARRSSAPPCAIARRASPARGEQPRRSAIASGPGRDLRVGEREPADRLVERRQHGRVADRLARERRRADPLGVRDRLRAVGPLRDVPRQRPLRRPRLRPGRDLGLERLDLLAARAG